jgi:uncharacterized membrane protein
MNTKLIFQLSIFGLAMAFATLSLIPEKIEPVFWLAIFVVCAYVIAKRCTGKYFLHGFCVSLVNCVWITAVHAWFFKTFMANHADMVKMSAGWPMSDHPRRAMLLYGPVFGIAFGLVLGLFAFVASRIVNKKMAKA